MSTQRKALIALVVIVVLGMSYVRVSHRPAIEVNKAYVRPSLRSRAAPVFGIPSPRIRVCMRVLQQTETSGKANTLEFVRSFKTVDGRPISPWHDIPLRPLDAPSDVFNFVCEIPKGCVGLCAGWRCTLPAVVPTAVRAVTVPVPPLISRAAAPVPAVRVRKWRLQRRKSGTPSFKTRRRASCGA